MTTKRTPAKRIIANVVKSYCAYEKELYDRTLGKKRTPAKQKSLGIAPGQYRTRDGRRAVVTNATCDSHEYPWAGSIEKSDGYSWTKDGQWLDANPFPADLVERMPDKSAKAKKTKLAIGYHINADAAWLAKPENQRIIKRLMKCAAKSMERVYYNYVARG